MVFRPETQKSFCSVFSCYIQHDVMVSSTRQQQQQWHNVLSLSSTGKCSFVEYLLAIRSWLLFNVCDYWSWVQKRDISGLSQFVITVEVRFVGCLRKGICNFPPLMCAAAKSFCHHLRFSSSVPCFSYICMTCLLCLQAFWRVLFSLRLVLLASDVLQSRFGRFTWYQMKFCTLSPSRYPPPGGIISTA